MKLLILMRHGKSSWEDCNLDDYDRPLNERGRRNAADMGAFLLGKTGIPDLVLSSPAKRAFTTAVVATEVMGYPKEKIVTDKELYLAWIDDILRSISKVPDTIGSCMVVGHNPGLTYLINHFGIRLDNLPTASTACFTFEVQRWKEITPDKARFQWLKQAKEI